MVTLLYVLQSSAPYYYEIPSFFSLFKCRTYGECQTVLHGSDSNGSAPLRNRFYQQQQQQQQQKKKKNNNNNKTDVPKGVSWCDVKCIPTFQACVSQTACNAHLMNHRGAKFRIFNSSQTGPVPPLWEFCSDGKTSEVVYLFFPLQCSAAGLLWYEIYIKIPLVKCMYWLVFIYSHVR